MGFADPSLLKFATKNAGRSIMNRKLIFVRPGQGTFRSAGARNICPTLFCIGR